MVETVMVAWRSDKPMCQCPMPLVVKWRIKGQWKQVRVLLDLPGDLRRAAMQDMEEFTDSGADAWAIGCPQCRTVYVGSIRVVVNG